VKKCKISGSAAPPRWTSMVAGVDLNFNPGQKMELKDCQDLKNTVNL